MPTGQGRNAVFLGVSGLQKLDFGHFWPFLDHFAVFGAFWTLERVRDGQNPFKPTSPEVFRTL